MRPIPDPGFPDDDGSADPVVRGALAAAASGGPSGPALAVLLRSRVLVPVVALLDEADYTADGLTRDKSSDMAAVMLTGRDGRQALLAFTGTDALTAWDGDARPVPVTLTQAAQAARNEGAAALVIDVAGPAVFVVEEADLRQAALGSQLVRVGAAYGWTRPVDDGSTGPV